jgi:outer membrane murein-binding lipoprotein Lpp
MTALFARRRPLGRTLVLSLFVLAPIALPAAGEEREIDALKAQLETLVKQNQSLARSVEELQQQVGEARDEARAARDEATAAPAVSAAPRGAGYGLAGGGDPLAQTSFGGTRFQLMDVSLIVDGGFGFSTAEDEELELLQGGDHDPRRRGFNIQNVELALSGAVDPYFTANANIVYLITPEGETKIELEEAYALTQQLPYGLERHGFQLKLGQFFTEFGRLNAKHPHQWDWQDQPLVLTRFFGGDGLRGQGARLGWLTPLPWYSEILVGAQNAQGETMVSFNASDEVFEERPIGGRPFASDGTRGAGDLVYLARWVNGGDLSDTWSTQVGVSALHGPNATGEGGSTWIYGIDGVLKWRPLVSDHGWPFVKIEGELLRRHYHADSFFGCEGGEEDCEEPLALSSDTLHDWGAYVQAEWGFRRPWTAGLRYEYATGSGASIGMFDGRGADPFRDNRQRIAPLLTFHPSEFSRIRLQYNYDRSEFSSEAANHTVWLGLEFGIGPHAAHAF